jgi:predicted dehydrogenase
MNRRKFLRTTATAAIAFPYIARSSSPNSKVVIAVIGASRNTKGGNGRGAELAVAFAGLKNTEVGAVCDVDAFNAGKAAEEVGKKAGKPPRSEKDFRRLLEDKEIDAVVIATPDHWHAPAAILACAAGKHVYVEKPCSHNAEEGALLVAAARKHQRHVQHGTQRRSWPGIQEAMAKLHEGAIGKVLSAKAYYFNARPMIGRGKEVPVPSGLDWALWQGPAPERPFKDNYVHYHWHWFWHWGTGELGNNGVHMIDVCRWGLGVDYAKKITSAGEKLRYDDDQETPDTNVAGFDFGGKSITWECRSWAAKTPLDPAVDCVFYGEKGVLTIQGSAYKIYDLAGKETGTGTGPGGNDGHLENFIETIRGNAKLNAEIEEGHKSTLLCHLGNVAWRTGDTVHFDPAAGKIARSDAAKALWGREYRAGWEPKI